MPCCNDCVSSIHQPRGAWKKAFRLTSSHVSGMDNVAKPGTKIDQICTKLSTPHFQGHLCLCRNPSLVTRSDTSSLTSSASPWTHCHLLSSPTASHPNEKYMTLFLPSANWCCFGSWTYLWPHVIHEKEKSTIYHATHASLFGRGLTFDSSHALWHALDENVRRALWCISFNLKE